MVPFSILEIRHPVMLPHINAMLPNDQMRHDRNQGSKQFANRGGLEMLGSSTTRQMNALEIHLSLFKEKQYTTNTATTRDHANKHKDTRGGEIARKANGLDGDGARKTGTSGSQTV